MSGGGSDSAATSTFKFWRRDGSGSCCGRRAPVLGAGGWVLRVVGEVEVMAGVSIVIVRAGDSELEKLGALQHLAAFTDGPVGDALTELVKEHQAGVMDRARAADG